MSIKGEGRCGWDRSGLRISGFQNLSLALGLNQFDMVFNPIREIDSRGLYHWFVCWYSSSPLVDLLERDNGLEILSSIEVWREETDGRSMPALLYAPGALYRWSKQFQADWMLVIGISETSVKEVLDEAKNLAEFASREELEACWGIAEWLQERPANPCFASVDGLFWEVFLGADGLEDALFQEMDKLNGLVCERITLSSSFTFGPSTT